MLSHDDECSQAEMKRRTAIQPATRLASIGRRRTNKAKATVRPSVRWTVVARGCCTAVRLRLPLQSLLGVRQKVFDDWQRLQHYACNTAQALVIDNSQHSMSVQCSCTIVHQRHSQNIDATKSALRPFLEYPHYSQNLHTIRKTFRHLQEHSHYSQKRTSPEHSDNSKNTHIIPKTFRLLLENYDYFQNT